MLRSRHVPITVAGCALVFVLALPAGGTTTTQAQDPASCAPAPAPAGTPAPQTGAGTGGGTAPAPARAAAACLSHVTALHAPRRLRAGRPASITVRADGGPAGGTVPVCLRPAGGAPECRTVELAAGVRSAQVRLTPRLAGRATLTAGGTLRRTVRVAPRGGRLRVLATGDSMIQIVDSYLAERLHRATVRSDAHISTGLTKPWMVDWPAHARESANAFRPDATVVFIGANDGYGLGDAPCCDGAWIPAYARRVRSMMRSYLRDGAARVYWILLPAPQGRTFQQIFDGVDAAVRRAARSFPHGVRVIDLAPAITPSGHFQRYVTRDGHRIEVRQSEGVHLTPAGASITADLVIRALRRDGLAS